jgi:alkylation response protein AidB-like acyl-CoA dehydrogenase
MNAASVSSLLDTVHQIEPVLRTYAPQAERERRLPDAARDAMRECGLYRLWCPQAFGGLEIDPITAFRVIEAVSELAGKKTPSYLAPLKARSSIQALIGEAQATLGAGRAYLYEALRDVWEKALEGCVIDMPGKMKLQLAAVYAAAASAKVVDLVHAAVGTTGIRDEYRFQRHFRDVHTLTQHAYISSARYESGGQYFLGVPIECTATDPTRGGGG